MVWEIFVKIRVRLLQKSTPLYLISIIDSYLSLFWDKLSNEKYFQISMKLSMIYTRELFETFICLDSGDALSFQFILNSFSRHEVLLKFNQLSSICFLDTHISLPLANSFTWVTITISFLGHFLTNTVSLVPMNTTLPLINFHLFFPSKSTICLYFLYLKSVSYFDQPSCFNHLSIRSDRPIMAEHCSQECWA